MILLLESKLQLECHAKKGVEKLEKTVLMRQKSQEPFENTETVKKEPNMEPKRRAIRECGNSDFSSPDASRALEPTIYQC